MMNKQVVRLNESQLIQIVRKSIDKLLKEGKDRNDIGMLDNQAIQLNTPESLVQYLSKNEQMSPQKSWFVTVGYVKNFEKLGDKEIQKSVEKIGDEEISYARGLNSKHLNKLIDSPQLNKKGSIINPYRSDVYSNYVVQIDVISLMYGRNDEWAKQKTAVKNDLEQYQRDNKDKVDYYLSHKVDKDGNPMIVDFANQSYDDARANRYEKVPNTNIKHHDDGSYSINFNTPKTVFKKLRSKYLLITDENTIEELTKEELDAYVRIYGVVPVKKESGGDETVKEVDKIIKDIKSKHSGGDVWTNYKLDRIFMMNFTTKGSHQPLQYYNEDVIIDFVKGRELKSGVIPNRQISKGLLKPYFNSMKN